MGQIFYSCAYDIDTKTCCVYEADKFHANCYSSSGTVFSMHYLLRQKAYRIMWGGNYVAINDNLMKFSRVEDLLGISTYLRYEDFSGNNNPNLKDYEGKALFIDENNKQWKRINVWEEALDYFDWDANYAVKYSGYLLNHTKKLAVDLADYYIQSKYSTKNGIDMAIDVVPVLTETGEGTPMAFFDGIAIETTEYLAGTWCGDLLQIVDDLPEDYQIINCCFVEIWSKAKDCFHKYGVNENGYIYKDNSGALYEVVRLDFYFKRRSYKYIKAEVNDNKIKYSTVPK